MTNKVVAKAPKQKQPLNAENIVEYAQGKTLDLHLASNSDQFVLTFYGGRLKAALISDLETLFKAPQFPRTLQKMEGVKTTQAPMPYGWNELQRCKRLTSQKRIVLVAYGPEVPFELWDVTEVVEEYLTRIDLSEVFGTFK